MMIHGKCSVSKARLPPDGVRALESVLAAVPAAGSELLFLASCNLRRVFSTTLMRAALQVGYIYVPAAPTLPTPTRPGMPPPMRSAAVRRASALGAGPARPCRRSPAPEAR